MKRKIEMIFFAGLILCLLTSFYLFSRFTVDDAFISWRYGKNLIDFGIWNYNPSRIDPTQAYTNPIYAALSIIPNIIKFDVVLFFKAISIISVCIFVYFFIIKRNINLMSITLFLALPQTVIHIFSGLETFVFVFLTAMLFIFLHEESYKKAIATCLILFLTRPEAWLFLILIPAYIAAEEKSKDQVNFENIFKKISILKIEIKKSLMAFAVLAMFIGAYFIFHKHYFHSALPNTFYIKSGKVFSATLLVLFFVLMAPIIAISFFIRTKLVALMTIFFASMALSYSTADLQMNYAGRFAFHIFAPIFLFSLYVAQQSKGSISVTTEVEPTTKITLSYKSIINSITIFALAIYFAATLRGTMSLLTYYPRALISHAELGKKLHDLSGKYDIHSFSLGDAGMAPYHSKLNVLDNIGLGSAMVARNGITDQVIEKYNIDLAIFHSSPNGIWLDKFNQKNIFEWVKKNKFIEVCKIYWKSDYTLSIYSKIEISELHDLCANTKAMNSKSDIELASSAILPPPWKFWRE